MPLLTKRLVDATPFPPDGQRCVRDDELPGFALRVTKRRKSFVLEKRIRGRMRRLTIGPYGPLTVEEARQLATVKIGAIAKGEDPAQLRQDQIHEVTFGDLAEVYLTRHAFRKRSGKDDASLLRGHLAGLRTRKLTDIHRTDLVQLHARLGARRPYRANRIVALVRTMFNLARDWGLFTGENPATRIQFFKERARDRFVQPEEMPRLLKAIHAEPNPYVRAALLTALLTGARREEVLTMTWPDVSLARGEWRIPQTKADRPHLLPLPAPLVTVLEALPRVDGNRYVFVGRDDTGHLVDLKRAWDRIRDEAGIPDVRIHDLRRTVGSWLAGSGESLPLIAKVLNHSSVSTTAIYARLNLEPVRHALERHASKLLSAGKSGPVAYLTARSSEEDDAAMPRESNPPSRSA
ncbi:MAG: site-specific integrase [Nitrospirae bacterium]|nr:MAG: site-specific integrase [Nitrospirota bacterium]